MGSVHGGLEYVRGDGKDESGARYHLFGMATYSYAVNHSKRYGAIAKVSKEGWGPSSWPSRLAGKLLGSSRTIVEIEEAVVSGDIISDTTEYAVDLMGVRFGERLFQLAGKSNAELRKIIEGWGLDPDTVCAKSSGAEIKDGWATYLPPFQLPTRTGAINFADLIRQPMNLRKNSIWDPTLEDVALMQIKVDHSDSKAYFDAFERKDLQTMASELGRLGQQWEKKKFAQGRSFRRFEGDYIVKMSIDGIARQKFIQSRQDNIEAYGNLRFLGLTPGKHRAVVSFVTDKKTGYLNGTASFDIVIGPISRKPINVRDRVARQIKEDDETMAKLHPDRRFEYAFAKVENLRSIFDNELMGIPGVTADEFMVVIKPLAEELKKQLANGKEPPTGKSRGMDLLRFGDYCVWVGTTAAQSVLADVTRTAGGAVGLPDISEGTVAACYRKLMDLAVLRGAFVQAQNYYTAWVEWHRKAEAKREMKLKIQILPWPSIEEMDGMKRILYRSGSK
jgi:hypothetical protein